MLGELQLLCFLWNQYSIWFLILRGSIRCFSDVLMDPLSSFSCKLKRISISKLQISKILNLYYSVLYVQQVPSPYSSWPSEGGNRAWIWWRWCHVSVIFLCYLVCFSVKLIIYNILIVQRDHLLPEEEAEVVGGGGGLEAHLVLWPNPFASQFFFR